MRKVSNIPSEEPQRNDLVATGIFLLVLIFIGRVQELISFFEDVPIGKISMGLCILLFFLTPGKTRLYELNAIPLFRYVIWIVVLCLLSVPFSVWLGGSIDYFKNVYFKTILFFLLLVVGINNREEINIIAWGAVLSGFLLGVKILMLQRIGRLTVSDTYDANDLAFVMVSLLPMVYYMMKSRSGFVRLFLMATGVIMLMTIIYTDSRGGFLGFIAITILILHREKQSLSKMLFIGAIVVSLFAVIAPSSFWERMGTSFDSEKDYNYNAEGSGRLAVWKRGMMLMATHPIFGVGIGGFETAEGQSHAGGGKWSSAHNSFVQIGAELGVIGLVMFIKLLVSAVKSIQESRIINRKAGVFPEWLLDGTEIGLYGYAVAGFFLSQAYSPILYFLVGLAIVYRKLLDAHEEELSLNRKVVNI